MNLKQSLEKHDFHGVWMRLLALAMILIVAVSALIASPVSANAAEVGDPSAVKGKTYAVGTDTTFAPFEYRENGKMTGIDMELIRAIAQEEGFEVTIQSLGFNAALQALSSNQVDVVIAGMSITDERKATYDFSNPYFQSGIQMAIAENNDSITSYKDLDGKTVVAKTGSEGESYAKQHASEYGYTVTSVDQSSTMYEMVKSGNADAVFDDYPVLAYGVSQNNGLKIVTPKVPHGEYGMAVNKGKNADLLAAIAALCNKRRISEQPRLVRRRRPFFCPESLTRKSIPRNAMYESLLLNSPLVKAITNAAAVRKPMPSTAWQRATCSCSPASRSTSLIFFWIS